MDEDRRAGRGSAVSMTCRLNNSMERTVPHAACRHRETRENASPFGDGAWRLWFLVFDRSRCSSQLEQLWNVVEHDGTYGCGRDIRAGTGRRHEGSSSRRRTRVQTRSRCRCRKCHAVPRLRGYRPSRCCAATSTGDRCVPSAIAGVEAWNVRCSVKVVHWREL